MSPSFVYRWPFIAAVALVAAAVSDVAVETIANAGAFGRAYFDTDDSTIVPSLIAGMLLASCVIGLHIVALWRASRGKRRGWLVDAARAVAAGAPLRDFPAIAAMQFAALFAMESAEQVLSTGHLAGGAVWLGAPLIVGVCLHVAIGAACTLAAGRVMRVSLAGIASLVCFALDFVLCALGRRGAAAFVIRRDASSCSHAQAARARHINGRAPPMNPAPA